MIAGKQLDILDALARYGYLTAPQIMKLGLYRDKASLYGALSNLGRLHLILGTEPQALPGAGRFPAVYALTAKGAEEIGCAIDRAVKPLRGAKPGKPPLDVEHRTAIVDCHIALNAWAETAGHRLAWFTPDFAPSSLHGRRATAIRTASGDYTPDALAVLDCADGIKRPLVFEVYRGGLTDRPQYLRAKLPNDLRAFAMPELRESVRAGLEGTFSAPRLLVITASDKLRDSVLSNPPAPELPGWGFTFLKTLAEIEVDFGGGWWRISKAQEPLFQERP
jgi:hypothetical protein